VKAKNAFGAELTYEWKAQLNRKGRQWSLAFCEIGGDVVYVDEETGKALEELADALDKPPRKTEPAPEPTKRRLPERRQFEFRV